jgi:hypothetical protein
VDPAAWRAQLKALLSAQFAALVRYPGIAKVVMAIMIPAGPNLLKLGEVMLALLRAGGLSERQAAYGCDIAGTYVKAVAQESSEWRSGLADRPDMRRRAAALSSYLGALPPGTFPYMNAVNELFSAETAGERFEFGLDVMLDGLAARAERSGGSE